MARLLADRFRLEVRLGRDRDIEQWLGTDTLLDRPVLIRRLGPETTETRREAFLAAVRGAAAVSHVHLAGVFAADVAADGAYAVQEWAGGVTLADRLDAGEAIAPEEFLPNAAGLAEALAALHAEGAFHGGIDTSAIMYSAAHPAKLDGFGRGEDAGTAVGDVQALAAALRVAVGSDATAQQALGRAGARALEAAAAGEHGANALAAALRAAPTARRLPAPGQWSWRWVAVGAGALVFAAIVALVGTTLRVRPSDSPLLFPAVPVQTAAPPSSSTITTAPPPASPARDARVTAVATYDPFGTGGERDSDLLLIEDGDPSTGWRTERYFDPLPLIKDGVGVTFAMEGAPASVEVTASPGTGFRIAWSPELPADFAGWEETATGRITGGRARLPLPERPGGLWLLWLTDLPAQDAGDGFYAYVYEVRFRG